MLGGRKKGDPRVKRALDELRYKYTVNSSGDYELIFELDDDRTQKAFVNSNTETFCEVEIREVWSVGFIADGMPMSKLANFLLLDNGRVKIGSWRIAKLSGGKVAIIYGAQVSADADAETLRACLNIVSNKADELENALGDGQDIL